MNEGINSHPQWYDQFLETRRVSEQLVVPLGVRVDALIHRPHHILIALRPFLRIPAQCLMIMMMMMIIIIIIIITIICRCWCWSRLSLWHCNPVPAVLRGLLVLFWCTPRARYIWDALARLGTMPMVHLV